MIAWDPSQSARVNVQRLCRHMNMRIVDIEDYLGLPKSRVNSAISYDFRTQNGAKTGIHNKTKAVLSRMFAGGIPDDWFGPVKGKQSLYNMMGCRTCRYRMKSQAGCVKFSLTKSDIDSGYFINTNKHGAFRLSAVQKCPYTGQT